MTTVYYARLVRWDKVEEILALVPPESRAEAQELLLGSIDHIVLETVLLHLPEDHHEEFLGKIHAGYHDGGVLDWLQDKVEGLEEILTRAIRETKSQIRSLLE